MERSTPESDARDLAEEEVYILLEGLRGEGSVAKLRRQEGIYWKFTNVGEKAARGGQYVFGGGTANRHMSQGRGYPCF